MTIGQAGAFGGDADIGKSAMIKGNLSVNSVTIAGTLVGNVVAQDRIELRSSARLNGDIKSKRLSVEDGVTFVGKSEVNPSGTPAVAATVASAAPAAAAPAAAAPAAPAAPTPAVATPAPSKINTPKTK